MKQVCEGTVRSQLRSNKKLFGEHSTEKIWKTVFKQSHHTTWTTTTMPIFMNGTLTHICPQKQREGGGGGKKNTTTTNNRLNCPHQVLDKAHGEKQAGQTAESPCADTSVAPMTDHLE